MSHDGYGLSNRQHLSSVHTNNRLTIKTRRYWSFVWEESTVTGGVPSQRASNVFTVPRRWCDVVISGPFDRYGLPLIPAGISNYIHYKMWDEITYLFPNFNGAAVGVWEWIGNFVPHFTGYVIIHPCYDLSQSMLVKGAPGFLDKLYHRMTNTMLLRPRKWHIRFINEDCFERKQLCKYMLWEKFWTIQRVD